MKKFMNNASDDLLKSFLECVETRHRINKYELRGTQNKGKPRDIKQSPAKSKFLKSDENDVSYMLLRFCCVILNASLFIKRNRK